MRPALKAALSHHPGAAPAPDAVEQRATLDQLIEKVRIIEGSVPAAVWQQAVEELEAYLGDFASLLGEESSHDLSRLRENAGPLLASFPGADAAATISRWRRATNGDSDSCAASPSTSTC